MAKKLKITKRYFSLLEVLIAFLIVVMCAIPLISPHVTIYRDQQDFIEKIDLDHAVNELYAQVIESLHRQAIPWEALEGKTKFPIESKDLAAFSGRPLLYKGYYQFTQQKRKPPKEENTPPKPFTLYLYKLTINLASAKTPNQSIEYVYDVFIPRQLSGEVPEELPSEGNSRNQSAQSNPSNQSTTQATPRTNSNRRRP